MTRRLAALLETSILPVRWSAYWITRLFWRPLRMLFRHLFATFVILGVVALGLGFAGLYQHLRYGPESAHFTWANVFFYTITLFLADTTVFENYGKYPVTLEIARFLAPLATAAGIADAAGALFAHRWETFRARHRRGHVVVCGTTPTARAIIDWLCARNRNVVLVADDATTVYPDWDHPRTLTRVDGDAREATILKRAGVPRSAVVYACLEDSAANVSVALSTRRLTPAGRTTPLRCIARVSAPGLVTNLRARRIGLEDDAAFRLDFFAADEIGARALLDRHLPDWDPGAPPKITILGLTGFGQALLVELAHRWRLDRTRADGTGPPVAINLPVTVIDPAATTSVRSMRGRHTVLENVAICPVDISERDFASFDIADALIGDGGGHSGSGPTSGSSGSGSGGRRPAYVYVCRDDDEVALLTGLEAVRVLETTRGDTPRSKVVIAIQRRQNFEEAFAARRGGGGPLLDDAGGGLRLFAVSDEALPIDLGDSDILDRFAQAIHARYLRHELANGHLFGSRASLHYWVDLPEHIKESNRNQAAHFGEVLRSRNLTLMPATSNSAPFGFAPAEVESLAQAEHERWMHNKVSQGYRYGPERVDAGPDKRSPSLIPWSELTEENKERDRDAIRNMPEVLTQALLQVVRLAGPTPPAGT